MSNGVKKSQVISSPITGRETTAELLDKAFGAFVGREVKTAYKIIRRMAKENHTVVLSFSGALTPADFGASCIIPLMKAGLIDILVTTGANLYHDMQRLISDQWFEVDPNFGDVALRKKHLTRIYDTVFHDRDLFNTDQAVLEIFSHKDFARAMTTPEFHFLLGKHLAGGAKKINPVSSSRASGHKMTRGFVASATTNGIKKETLEKSVLYQAYKLKIPIFCGAPQDGSIFLNLALAKRLAPDKYKFALNLETDIHEFASYHYLAKAEAPKKLSVIILGGGVPKNYSLQGEPYLGQICDIDVGGYDSDVQICDAHLQNGGLSSCTAAEAHTWGKTSEECLKSSQYVFADVTSTFPFIVHALLQEGLNKKPRRLLGRREEALSLLDKALNKRWRKK